LASGFHHQPLSHCAELTPGVATVTIAIGVKATTMPVARRRINVFMTGPPTRDRARLRQGFSLCRARTLRKLMLQRMLGHKSAKVTLDTYADLFDADLDAVAVTLHASYSLGTVAKVWPPQAHDATRQT
jgi:integrase